MERKRRDMTGTTIAILFNLGGRAWLTRDLVLQYRTWQGTEPQCRITKINQRGFIQRRPCRLALLYIQFRGETIHGTRTASERAAHRLPGNQPTGVREDPEGEHQGRPGSIAAAAQAVLFQGIPSACLFRWIGTLSFCVVVTLDIVLRGGFQPARWNSFPPGMPKRQSSVLPKPGMR